MREPKNQMLGTMEPPPLMQLSVKDMYQNKPQMSSFNLQFSLGFVTSCYLIIFPLRTKPKENYNWKKAMCSTYQHAMNLVLKSSLEYNRVLRLFLDCLQMVWKTIPYFGLRGKTQIQIYLHTFKNSKDTLLN